MGNSYTNENNNSKDNSNSNENSKRSIIILSIIATITFVSFFAVYFVTQNFDISSNKKDVVVLGIYSTSELKSIAKKYCGNVSLVSSEYFDKPEARRVCTFKDEDRNFTFTVKSVRGPINQLTLIPLYDKKYESDYEARFYEALKPHLESNLAKRNINVVDYYLSDKSNITEKGFSFGDKVLITTKDDEIEDTELIINTLEEFGIPNCYSNYKFDTYYLEDLQNEKSNSTDNNNDSNDENSSNYENSSNNDVLNILNNNSDDSYNNSNSNNETSNNASPNNETSNNASPNNETSENVVSNYSSSQSGLTSSDNKKFLTYGLSDLTLERFSVCAMYLSKGTNTRDGKPLSSKDYSDIEDFLFNIRCSNGASGPRIDPDTQVQTSYYVSCSYKDWEYLLKELYGEEHPEAVKSKLDEKFDGEYNVYFNPSDDKIYAEFKDFEQKKYAEVNTVSKDKDLYLIAYNVYDSNTNELTDTVNVIIKEADNDYGYKLIAIQ